MQGTKGVRRAVGPVLVGAARRGPRVAAAMAAVVVVVVATGGVVAGTSSAASAADSPIVYAFGDDNQGQLGNVAENGYIVGETLDPIPVVDFSTNVKQFATNGRTSAVVHTDGTVWTFGDNLFYMLGDGTTQDTMRYQPMQVPGLSNIVQVSMAEAHALAVAADGTVWAWGDNAAGDLGDGKTTAQEPNAHTPVRAAASLSGVVQVAAGGSAFSVALRSNGEVWAWGNNLDGELGNGTFTDSATPVRTSVPYGITQIAAGSVSAMALRSPALGGYVYAWGANNVGQLGVPTSTTSSNVAVRVGGQAVANITQIAAGDLHGVALQNDGSVWTWGFNDGGQLGDNGPTDTPRATPARLTTLSGVTTIAAGGRQSAAVTQDGTLWNWGRYLNQVSSVRFRPFQIAGTSGVTQIAVGDHVVMFSMPPRLVFVPSLVGQVFDNGTPLLLNRVGLALGSVSTQVDPTCTNLGKIVSETPVGLVPAGTAISLVYLVAPAGGCTSTVVVPNVNSQTQSNAITTLTNAGLAIGTISSTRTTDQLLNGKVITQTPAAGTAVTAGTPVNLSIGVWDGTRL
jgi:alpha-tubulin suppressor-like RCC1 family protein